VAPLSHSPSQVAPLSHSPFLSLSVCLPLSLSPAAVKTVLLGIGPLQCLYHTRLLLHCHQNLDPRDQERGREGGSDDASRQEGGREGGSYPHERGGAQAVQRGSRRDKPVGRGEHAIDVGALIESSLPPSLPRLIFLPSLLPFLPPSLPPSLPRGGREGGSEDSGSPPPPFEDEARRRMHAALAQQRDTMGVLIVADTDGVVGVVCVGVLCVADEDQKNDTVGVLSVASDADGVGVVCVGGQTDTGGAAALIVTDSGSLGVPCLTKMQVGHGPGGKNWARTRPPTWDDVRLPCVTKVPVGSGMKKGSK
jgi:hypothetical protein